MADPIDTLDALRLTIRSLEVASKRIITTYESEDIDAAAVEVHFGLHAAYDLFEVFFRSITPVTGAAAQDTVLDKLGGQSLGALAVARGAHTHKMISFAGNGGWPDSPQGMMPGVRGWVWAKHKWPAGKLVTRGIWYDECVEKRMLHTAIDDVSRWGTDRYWEYVEANGLEDLAQERRERADMNFV